VATRRQIQTYDALTGELVAERTVAGVEAIAPAPQGLLVYAMRAVGRPPPPEARDGR